MNFLGIETSCDETAIALISSHERAILWHMTYSQIAEHRPYGGVVPNVAAHAHRHKLPELIAALDAQFPLASSVDGIAVTAGPGLVGGLLVGVMLAQGLALGLGKPLWPINHLEAHALMVRFFSPVPFPYCTLLVSGGHSQLVVMKGVGDALLIGQSIDDAVGECFDKVARLLGLPYPGGPAIEALARKGTPGRYSLPTPLKGKKECSFSFSGLKTACQQCAKQFPDLSLEEKADFCADFQEAVGQHLMEKTRIGLRSIRKSIPDVHHFVVSGGVASNLYLRQGLERVAQEERFHFAVPPPQYCTDNGIMIAWAGAESFAFHRAPQETFSVRPRCPLGSSFMPFEA